MHAPSPLAYCRFYGQLVKQKWHFSSNFTWLIQPRVYCGRFEVLLTQVMRYLYEGVVSIGIQLWLSEPHRVCRRLIGLSNVDPLPPDHSRIERERNGIGGISQALENARDAAYEQAFSLLYIS